VGDTIALYLLSLFYPLLKGMGVNTVQLAKIMETRLKIDGRRPAFMLQTAHEGSERNSVNMVVLTLIMGALLGSILFVFPDKLLGLTVYFSIFMILITLSLLANFSSMLFDMRDQFIIAPRPVDDRTYTISKLAHIAIYVLRLALLQSAPALVMIGFVDGLAAMPVFLLQVVEATIICLIVVNLIYLTLLKSVNQQRFKDSIFYLQAAMSIVTLGVYFMLTMFFPSTLVARSNILDRTWSWSLPPLWVACLNSVIVHPGSVTWQKVGLALLGIACAFGGFWFIIKVLASGFIKRLSALASSEGQGSGAAVAKQGSLGRTIAFFERRLTSSPEEKAGFLITSKLMFRSREFMMKIIPFFVFGLIYFGILAMNNNGDGLRNHRSMPENHLYVGIFYSCFIAFSAIIQHVSFSERYKSDWVYYVFPIQVPGRIQAGMFKGIVAMIFVPYFLIVTVIGLVLWGPSILQDAGLALGNCLIFGLLLSLFTLKGFPFSKPISLINSDDNVYAYIIPTLVLSAIGFVHFKIAGLRLLIGALAFFSFGIYLVLMSYYKKRSWADIESRDYY